MSVFAITIPVRTVSELNKREHWGKGHARTAKQRDMVAVYCRQIRGRGKPIRMKFTRIGKRDLDWGDNLNASFKHVRDELAALCGFNDRAATIKWEYHQRRPEPGEEQGTHIEIEWADNRPDMMGPPLKKRLKPEGGQGRLFIA